MMLDDIIIICAKRAPTPATDTMPLPVGGNMWQITTIIMIDDLLMFNEYYNYYCFWRKYLKQWSKCMYHIR